MGTAPSYYGGFESLSYLDQSKRYDYFSAERKALEIKAWEAGEITLIDLVRGRLNRWFDRKIYRRA